MRFRLFLLISLATITCFSGCRARRQVATTDVVADSKIQSGYWAGRDDSGSCDHCDSGVCDDGAVEGSGIIRTQPDPSDSMVEDPVATRRLRFFNRRRIGTNSNSKSLNCQVCNQQHSVLVDGTCVNCMKSSSSPVASGEFPNGNDNAKSLMPRSGRDQFIPRPITNDNLLTDRLPKPQPKEKLADSDAQNSQGQTVMEHEFSEKKSVSSDSNGLNSNDTDSEVARSPSTEPVGKSTKQQGHLLKQLGNQFESSLSDYLANRAKNASPKPPLTKSKNTKDELPAVGDLATNETEATESKDDSGSKVAKEEINANADNMNEFAAEKNDAKIKPVKTGISGNASLLPNPRFETFSLDDLFVDDFGPVDRKNEDKQSSIKDDIEWGPPIKVQAKPNDLDKQSQTWGGRLKALHRPDPGDRTSNGTPQTVDPGRSAEEGYQEPGDSALPERVVVDNGKVKSTERVQSEADEIILQAKPSPFYHEIQRLAAEQKRQKNSIDPDAGTGNRNSIPVIRAKSRIDRSGAFTLPKAQFEFNPLPNLEAGLPEDDLGTASSIGNKVYQPYEFPETGEAKSSKPVLEKELNSTDSIGHDQEFGRELLKAIYQNNDILSAQLPANTSSEQIRQRLATSKLEVNSDHGGEVSTRESELRATLRTLPVNDMRGAEVATDPILLKAVPEAREVPVEQLQLQTSSQAKFRFLEPNDQRVVDDE